MCQADRLALIGVVLRDTIWYAEAHPAVCRVRSLLLWMICIKMDKIY